MAVKKPASIIALEDFDESVNMMVYGDSGVGKTVFAGSAPRTLFLATEKGTISAKRQGSTADVWQIEHWSEVQEAYKFLKGSDHGYDWVSMDSAEAMQHMALRWILDAAVEENSNRDPDIPQIQDHQKWQNMFKRFIKVFCDLPVNVLFTATTMRSEDEEGESIILPNLQGKGYGISQWVCAQMHVVAYMRVMRKGKGDDKETWRRLQTQTVPPYFGKDRYNCLGEYNENGSVVRPYLDGVTLEDVTKLIASSGVEVSTSVDMHPKRVGAKGVRQSVAARRKGNPATKAARVVNEDDTEDED